MNLANLEAILGGLNPPQREAVETTDGPLLIQAGAGSGKTKTLTHRIAYLIMGGQASSGQILAVTFTNKAAGEMRARLASMLGVNNDRSFMPWMGTFHSIAVKILRIYGRELDIPREFTIFDETDKLVLIKSILKDLGAGDKQFNPRTIASYISNAKNDCLSPSEYLRQATRSPMEQMAAEVYGRYAKRMKQNEALDFDDLLLETVRLLKEVPEVRKKLQDKFRYILIDEYQDTNKAQYQMVKLLLNDRHNICAVGDDWQSIYSWRGADFTNILNFERDFPGAKVIKLEQNYRSTEEILNAAHNVITKNTTRSSKKLWTDNKGGQPVEIIEASNEFDEAERVANRVLSEVAVGARNYRDFAVLYRTNAQSRVFEQMFLQRNVPYRIVGGLRFYDRAEIKDLTAYLKIIYQPHDTISFRRIVNVPKRGLGEVSVDHFLRWQSNTNQDVLGALKTTKNCPELSSRAQKSLEQLGRDLAYLREQIDKLTPDKLLEEVINRFSYTNYVDDGTDQGIAKKENIDELISMAKEYGDLTSFLEEVALISSSDTANLDNAVTLMTLHAAKGLEFPVVFLVGMEDGLFPSVRSALEPAKMEEERRLCYVGMTRAMEELILSWARRRTVRGDVQFNSPSSFLADASGGELPSSKLDGFDDAIWEQPNRSLNFNYDQPRRIMSRSAASDEPYYEMEQTELQIGDRVRHQMFGVGQVVDIDGNVILVDFKGHQRRLNLAFTSLTRL